MKFRDLPDEIHEVIWMLGTVCILMGIIIVIGWVDSSKDFGWGLMWCGIGWLIYKIGKYVVSKIFEKQKLAA